MENKNKGEIKIVHQKMEQTHEAFEAVKLKMKNGKVCHGCFFTKYPFRFT